MKHLRQHKNEIVSVASKKKKKFGFKSTLQLDIK